MALAYLARWSGPVLESQDPYDPQSGDSPPDLQAKKHVQEILYLPRMADYSNLKQAIMQYGGVISGFHVAEAYYRWWDTFAYYCYIPNQPDNHTIEIVGWDDHFSRYNFVTDAPGDGAFIARESMGTPDYSDGGYFYISYYDQNIGMNCGVVTAAEPTKNFIEIYQYDWLGWTAFVGYPSNDKSSDSDDTAWCANIFTARDSERLSAVSFYNLSPDSSYEVWIYLDSTSGPRSGVLATAASGILRAPGYHTIYLPDHVQLQAGQKFMVMLRLHTPGNDFPIAVEQPIQFYSSAATANPGESYVSPDGTNWTDLAALCPNTNVCLKAFTTASQPALYAIHLASDTTWWTRISLLNAGSVCTPVQFVAINQDGQVLETKSIAMLPPSNSYSADVSELFRSDTLSQGLWVKILSNSALKGVLEFGTRDNLSQATIPLLESGDNEIIYPYVVHTSEWYTGITIVNSQYTTAGITIEAYNEAGDLLGSTVTTIPPQGKYVRLMSSIIDGIDPLLIRFLRVRSNQALLGFELFGSFVNNGLAGMPAVSPGRIYAKTEGGGMPAETPSGNGLRDPTPAGTYSLIYNVIPYCGDFFAGVTFSNLGPEQISVQNRLYQFDGTLLGQYCWPEPVDSLQQITRDLWTACGLGCPNENAAYMMAGSSSPLMGFELFLHDTGDPDTFLLDGLECATGGSTTAYMPVVKAGSEWGLDRLNLTNLSDALNNFTVFAYSSSGEQLWTYAGSLPARGQFAGEIDAADNPDVAWMKIQAEYPIVSSILYISSDWKRMGAYLGLE